MWNRNRAQLPPSFGLRFPPISDSSFPLYFVFPLPGESFVNCVVCPVKIGGSFDLQPYQNSPPLFFTGRRLRPPGIGIEATGYYLDG